MVVDNRTEYKQGDLTFILFPTKTVVATPLQRFYLYPRATYWNRRHNLIRFLISTGDIRDLNDLAAWCDHHDKETGEFKGQVIEWRATALPVEAFGS
jgi:hypothetical protein